MQLQKHDLVLKWLRYATNATLLAVVATLLWGVVTFAITGAIAYKSIGDGTASYFTIGESVESYFTIMAGIYGPEYLAQYNILSNLLPIIFVALGAVVLVRLAFSDNDDGGTIVWKVVVAGAIIFIVMTLLVGLQNIIMDAF